MRQFFASAHRRSQPLVSGEPHGKRQCLARQCVEGLRTLLTACLVLVLLVSGSSAAWAEDAPCDPCATVAKKKPGQLPNGRISLTKLIPPVTRVFGYKGPLCRRSTLTGDWGGTRSCLYERGFSIDATLTQVWQGVTSGGKSSGGSGNYNGLVEVNAFLDTAKVGMWSGGLLAATVQASYGDPISGQVGNVSPVNMTPMWPVPFEDSTELMEYYLMQALPGELMLIVGRVDATNFLDKSSFANNPESQFLNASLNNQLLWGEFLSFSTYAALLVAELGKHWSVGGAVWDPETQPGDYGGVWENVGAAVTATYKYKICGLAGLINPVLAYTSKDAVALDNPRLVPGIITGNPPSESGNWMFTFTGEQFLWTPRGSAIPRAKGGRKESYSVPAQDFVSNAPGLGLFYRFAYTPEDRNPWNITASGGFGGRGIISGRPWDRMGIGAYTMLSSGDLNAQPIIGGILRDEVGAEAFYNFAVTPALQISADVQWISQGIRGSGNAVVVGLRLFTRF